MLVIYSYPDQLLSEVWADWCESVLDPAKNNFRRRPNFQDALGAQNSNDRTRAGESYSIGLLKGPLVRPQSAGGGAIPLGWELVQSGASAQSRLGYLAYAIGRVMRDANAPQSIQRAFSVLCALFVLQLGIKYKGQFILSASLYQHLLKHFQPTGVLPEHWNRYLAVAMFCTLHSNEHGVLIETYLDDEPVEELYLVYSGRKKNRVNPAELAKMAEDGVPVSNVSPPKDALFWIGSVQEVEPRGVYSYALKEGKLLLELAAGLERDAIKRGVTNPFANLIIKNPNTEQNAIEELDAIFRANSDTTQEWERLMKNLSDGVIDALAFLSGKSGRGGIQTFYAHDLTEPVDPSQNLELEVAVSQCVSIPNQDDRIIINGILYHVLHIAPQDDRLVIGVVRA